MRLSISPSKLEQFRKYLDSEMNGFITKDSVIETILGVKQFKQQMEIGSSLHAIIENGVDKYRSNDVLNVFEVGMKENISLKEENVLEAVLFAKKHKGSVHEVWHEEEFRIGIYDVVMPMRIDMLFGDGVHEIKTTSRDVSFEDFFRSCQWKCYAIATAPRYVEYNVFQYVLKDVTTDIYFKRIDFRFYVNLNECLLEVRNLLRMFIEFCEANNLIEKLIKK